MHPDEATEAILDLALANNKAFAIVPCCVFAHLAPDRCLPPTGASDEGKQVRTINEFCDYLKAKDPERIQEALLPFEGRNKVLYIK